jgi:hypothetical protein
MCTFNSHEKLCKRAGKWSTIEGISLRVIFNEFVLFILEIILFLNRLFGVRILLKNYLKQ